MDTYFYTVCERFEKEVLVEAESREEARKKLDEMLINNDEKVRIDYENDCCGSWEELDKIVEDDSEKEYEVLITEKLEKKATVSARNKFDAVLEARRLYSDEKSGFVLTADDFVDCDIKVIGKKGTEEEE